VHYYVIIFFLNSKITNFLVLNIEDISMFPYFASRFEF